MNKRTAVLAASLLLSLGPVSVSLGAFVPPTDEQVNAAVSAFTEATRGITRDPANPQGFITARRDAAKAALGDLSIAETTASQLARLAQLTAAAGQTEAVNARLETLAQGRDIDGARAAAMRLDSFPSTYVPPLDTSITDPVKLEAAKKAHDGAVQRAADAVAKQRELILAVLDHPALREALRAGDAANVFSVASRLDSSLLKEEAGILARYESIITPDLPTGTAPRLVTVLDALLNADPAPTAATRERFRQKIATSIGAAKSTLDPANEKDAETLNRLTRTERYVNGPFARGTLVGNSTPEMNVLWTNSTTPIRTMADLRGKVVVLDFWATWCGPCIGSFPNVRELTKHYEGYPVAVIGITSPQGYHISRPEGAKGKTERIDTKGEPEKEFALMPEFIKQLDMTWTVAFTDQDVFNPDYGVRGIPHVAILDPNGIVRYRGMHPGTDLNDKYHKIDGLLKEFKLPTPPESDAAAEKSGG